MEQIDKFAFRLFGDHVHEKEDSYQYLRKEIKSANLPIPWDVYVAKAYLYSVAAAAAGLLVLGLISFLVLSYVDIPPFIRLPGPLSTYQDFVVQYRTALGAIAGAIILGPIIGGMSFFGYLMLPQFKSYDRARNIDINLPGSITFLYAITRGGANVIEAFRELSQSENAYGETSREAALIVRDMEIFGDDINSALRNRVEQSPSRDFSEFCASLISILDSGGNVTKFFREKAEEYERESLQALKGYLETLGLLAETYTTAFVAGPIFIIIMTSVMTLMQGGGGGMATMGLFVTVYAVLPIGAVMFVVLIDMLSPEEAQSEFEPFETQHASRYLTELDEEQEKRFKTMERGEKMHHVKERLKAPHKPFLDKPLYSLAIGIPLGLAILAIGLIGAPLGDIDPLINHIDDYVIAMILATILPLALFHELKKRRIKGLRRKVPDLLSQLASMNEMGLNLVESFNHVGGGKDRLSKEMHKVQRELSWGEEVSLSLKKFANRVRSADVLKAMTLITRALRASGEISKVLRIAAEDALRRREIERERTTQIFVYVVIIYLSFLVFIAIIGILAVKFLPVMQGGGAGGAGGSAVGGMTLGGGFDVALFKRSFFHGAVIQGFSSGLVAGKMGEGAVLSGLKHSIIMMIIAYIAFVFIL